MKPIPPLTSENVQSVLQSLLFESTRQIEEPYDNAYNKARLAYLRQSLKCVDLWVQTEEHRAIQARLDVLERYVSETRQAMYMPDADEWIRSRHGI